MSASEFRRLSYICTHCMCQCHFYVKSLPNSLYAYIIIQSFNIVLLTESSMEYEQLKRPLMFSSCDVRKCINVTIENDDITEQNETFSVSLQRTATLDSRITLNPKSATVHITDDDGMHYTSVPFSRLFNCASTVFCAFHFLLLNINIKYEKHFQKMYRDVGMAVPKTTETRCRDGSVQGRHVIQRLHN